MSTVDKHVYSGTKQKQKQKQYSRHALQNAVDFDLEGKSLNAVDLEFASSHYTQSALGKIITARNSRSVQCRVA